MVDASQNFFDCEQTRSGTAVRRNGVRLKTPGGADVIVPEALLGEAICAEWRAQGEKPNSATMPLFQLACTTLDHVERDKGGVVKAILAFAENELLCHRAETPPELKERQAKLWQPVLDWALRRFDATMTVGEGLMPIRQPATSIAALKGQIDSYDAFVLAGLRQAVEVSGSFILGLALAEQHFGAGQVFELSELDASFQMEKWGDDPAVTKRRESVRFDLNACEQWFKLLRRQN